MFELKLFDRNGNKHTIFYDPHTSSLTDENGKPFSEPSDKMVSYNSLHKVSPENPGSKTSNIKTLKIQLGLGCNYTCSYCLQKEQIKDASKTNIRDAEIFIKNLEKWLTGEPKRIEFWGGEPLLYWAKIKFLLPELHEKFPLAKFVIVTNGSLIDDDFIDHVKKYNIDVAISHDGPGQHVRGPDPLDDPHKFAMIKKLIEAKEGNISFNAVINPENYNLEKIENFFREKVPNTNFGINYEGVVISYDGDKNVSFTKEQYHQLMQNVTFMCMRPKDKIPYTLYNKMKNFTTMIEKGITSDSLSQKCGMDREDSIAVDLLGNVMTCQNTGAAGKHRIGHVNSLDKVSLNTSWHWSHRAECSSCPVLMLCAGSCMYVEGKDWYYSCNNEYYYNMGILAGALFHMFGLVLEEINGDILRPDPEQYGLTKEDNILEQ